MSNYFTDRIVQHPGRIKLTDVSTSEEKTVDVTRQEGTVSEAGTQLDAQTLNGIMDTVITDVIGETPVTYENDTSSSNIASGMTIEETFARLKTLLTSLLKIEIQAGETEGISVNSSSTSENVSITFGQEFTDIPAVVLSIKSASVTTAIADVEAFVTSKSKTGINLRIANNTSSQRTIYVSWVAVNIKS